MMADKATGYGSLSNTRASTETVEVKTRRASVSLPFITITAVFLIVWIARTAITVYVADHIKNPPVLWFACAFGIPM